VNDHLRQFGVYEVSHQTYKKQLDLAVEQEADFRLDGISEADLIARYFEGDHSK
jgi:Leu/Phe-tRNA-protein transferase